MSSFHIHPYRTPSEIRDIVDRLHKEASPLVHPQQVLEDLRHERAAVGRFNGWLADHIVGLAGTMGFFYSLCVLMIGWSFWQSYVLRIKDEADHRAWSHLYDVNDEQLKILRQLAARLLEEEPGKGKVGESMPQ